MILSSGGFLEGRNGIASRPRGQIIVIDLACVEIAAWWNSSGDAAGTVPDFPRGDSIGPQHSGQLPL